MIVYKFYNLPHNHIQHCDDCPMSLLSLIVKISFASAYERIGGAELTDKKVWQRKMKDIQILQIDSQIVREIVRKGTDTNRDKLVKIDRAGCDWLCGKIYGILMILLCTTNI